VLARVGPKWIAGKIMTPEISSQIDSPNVHPAVPAALPAACDILIIRGATAGSTATLLERLGAAEKVRPIGRSIGMEKRGLESIAATGQIS
jgi:hypothetical protein